METSVVTLVVLLQGTTQVAFPGGYRIAPPSKAPRAPKSRIDEAMRQLGADGARPCGHMCRRAARLTGLSNTPELPAPGRHRDAVGNVLQ